MKLVIDSTIPFIEGVFEPYCEVVYLPGKMIHRADIKDADALMVRSRTHCGKSMLKGTSVKIIATATIGTDHIDLDFCKQNGIYVSNAAGYSTGAVMNYVFSALYGTAARKAIDLTGATFGIIGMGRAGTRVAEVADMLGFHVFKCDPPREERERNGEFCSLEYLLQNSLIVSLHAPLNEQTKYMANDDFFAQMLPGAFFINTARGKLVDEKALKRAIPKLGPVIIDTWDNEPGIDHELMDMVDIATPHIAGYSYQGKQLGTAMSVRAIARFFGIESLYDFFPKTPIKELEAINLNIKDLDQGTLASTFQYNYPIFTDDFMLRLNPDKFESLRANYSYRREFNIE